jgi:outer membrane protein assembly factor BamA
LKKALAKISIFTVIISVITSCNVVKRVGDNQHLLTQTSVLVNSKKNPSEELKNLIYQHPNGKLFGIPLRLHIYNLARDQRDSLFEVWLDKHPKRRARLTKKLSKKQVDQLKESSLGFNNWLRKTGEAPVIIDSLKTIRSEKRLERYYTSNGWFNRKITHDIKTGKNKRASIEYHINTGKPYTLDSIFTSISSALVDSLYQISKESSLLKKGNQYKDRDFTDERDRLSETFRNSGVYHFSQDYVRFEIDTIGKNKKVDVDVIIQDRIIRNEDSVTTTPFKIYTIKAVNIITDDAFVNRGKPFQDSISYENYTLFSYGKMRYRPKALIDAVFISKDHIFRDVDRINTYRHLNELRTFKYPTIDYIVNDNDNTLTANILLSPRKKYGLGFDIDISQSNIQSIGLAFSTSLFIRNIFRGAETLEISALGSIGASKDNATKDQFFDINEIGVDAKLTIPRFFFPFNTKKIIPKYMSPSTRISLGFTSQTNIGLDKQTVNGILNYNWSPSKTVTNSVDLFSTQYIRNLNPQNYFSVYQNSYKSLNNIAQQFNQNPLNIDASGNLIIPSGANNFISEVLNEETQLTPQDDDFRAVNNIDERKQRLTEDNLIISSNFSFIKDKRESLTDQKFSIFRFKFEAAGNILKTLSSTLGLKKNQDNKYELFGVAFSQYLKTELDYIKYWSLGGKNVLATRSYFGIAIPYGNSNSIPFSKSFFAGGPNDNRAWTAYDLGPGSSNSNNEFNEANMKLAFSLEHRFNLFGSVNGALFIDAGNIWNVRDSEVDPNAIFDSFSSLKDIAIGSGFGLRYDFGFFVLRGDIGFKTYDPSFKDNNRWFNDYNFANAVYNIGINYPF